MSAQLEIWIVERNRALRTLDMRYARQAMPGAASDEVRLIAMHKARYEATGIPKRLRQASRAWLEARGLSRMYGQPWPAESEVPA